MVWLMVHQEHSVMYPIDLLKVCYPDVWSDATLANFQPPDTDASRQSDTCGDIYGHR